jgi:hypothetical protein
VRQQLKRVCERFWDRPNVIQSKILQTAHVHTATMPQMISTHLHTKYSRMCGDTKKLMFRERMNAIARLYVIHSTHQLTSKTRAKYSNHVYEDHVHSAQVSSRDITHSNSIAEFPVDGHYMCCCYRGCNSSSHLDTGPGSMGY